MTVFIGIQNKTNFTTVYKARDYQSSAFITFMSNKKVHKMDFSFPNNIIFHLEKLDTHGLKGNYSRFCVLVNESGEKHILSDNEDLLRGYVGWKNRLTLSPISKSDIVKD